MDILNFISWIRGKRQVTTVDPTKTLIPVGLKDGRRDDEYLAGAISVEDFAAQIAPSSTNIYNSNGTLTGNRTLNGDNKELTFNNLNRFQLTTGSDSFVIAKTVFPNVSSVAASPLNTSVTIDALNQINSTLNTTFFVNQSLIKSIYGGVDKGLKLDFANRTYELGQLTGNNVTTLKIDDAAAYPVQVSGTNVAANTAGAASGQFLKIKVNGVDYKIALLNP